MFTVARLGIVGRLAKTLTVSNPIESMIPVARTTNRNATRLRDGQMVWRWTAGGHAQRPTILPPHQRLQTDVQLVDALRRHANLDTETVGAAA